MTRTTIDTQRLSARLKKEGLAAEQADAFARALGDELGADTRSDLEDPVKRARLTTEIRMFKWVFGFAILATLTAFVALFESLDRIRVQQSRNNAQLAVLDDRMKQRLDAADEQMKHRLDAADKQMKDRLDAADEQMKVRFIAADEQMKVRFIAADEQMKVRFDAVDVRMDERFNTADVQFELLGQRIGNVEALVRELISLQRGGTAAGAGATAGGQVRTGPAARAPEGVMR